MESPLVIVHLIATNFYGGPEKQIVNHALHLDSRRFRFLLITFSERDIRNELVDVARTHGLEVIELPVGSPFDPRLIKILANILKRHKAQLLCAHGYKANVIGRLATWLCHIPQVVISRGWTAENRKIKIFEKIDRIFLRFSQHIVAVSDGQKQKIIAHGVTGRPLTVIRNAINLPVSPVEADQSLRRQLGLPDDALLVVSAGRLSPEKNQKVMIEVARQIVQHNSRVYFIVFGEGFLRSELEQQIVAFGLKERFLLPGFSSDLQALLPQIDIFMLPSFSEGLPNVVLEAFAARKPVLASAVGGTPEVVLDGISGFLTRPDDIDEMTKFLIKLLDDDQLCRKMGAAGYHYIEQNYDFESQTMDYENLYKRLITQPEPSDPVASSSSVDGKI